MVENRTWKRIVFSLRQKCFFQRSASASLQNEEVLYRHPGFGIAALQPMGQDVIHILCLHDRHLRRQQMLLLYWYEYISIHALTVDSYEAVQPVWPGNCYL